MMNVYLTSDDLFRILMWWEAFTEVIHDDKDLVLGRKLNEALAARRPATNVYLEVQNNRTNTLKRLILWKPWYVRVRNWLRQVWGGKIWTP